MTKPSIAETVEELELSHAPGWEYKTIKIKFVKNLKWSYDYVISLIPCPKETNIYLALF